MSAGITSAVTPVQLPVTSGGGAPNEQLMGGGDVTPIAPDPAPDAPEAGAQPAAPGDVSGGDVQGGGGTGGGDTSYEAAPQPAACGQWVPAPVATGDTAPSDPPAGDDGGGDTPPDPIAGPDAGTGTEGEQPAATATTPASQLSTWPQWQQEFTALGLKPEEIARIGAANLGNEQLATVYEDIRTGITDAGGTPGVTAPGSIPGQSAWSPAWEQKFAALGLPAEFITELRTQSTQRGSNEQQLQSVYDQLVQAKAGGAIPGQSTWNAAWDQKFAALGLPPAFVAELKSQAMKTGADDQKIQSVYDQLAAKLGAGQGQGTPGVNGPQGQQGPAGQQGAGKQDGPGWNPQVEKAFRALGMPDDVIKLYANSGAPLSGLEAAYKHAASRVEDFKQRGWWDKFAEAKVDPVQEWSLILGDQPVKDEDAQKVLDAARKGQRTMFQRGAQLTTSIIPGGRLLQYAFGKEFVSGDSIDRTSPMEIGFAALSGVALFAAFKGARNLGAAWKLRDGGFEGLNNVNNTLRGLNLPATGTEAMEQTAMGATQTWGLKQKLISMIPGTALHKDVVGLGHAEAAARAFNNGGAAKLMADPDGALQVASLAQMFDDIKSGATRIQGGSIAYLGNLRKTSPMTLQVNKGQEIIKVAKSLGIGNGNTQLVGLTEMAGKKLGQTPEWLRSAADLVDDVNSLAKAERDTLGAVMAGNAARNLGSFSADGGRMVKYVRNLGNLRQPEWYTRLAQSTASQWPGNGTQLSPQLLDVLTGHRVYGQIFEEGAAAIAALDRTNLPEGMSGLLDDATAKMSEARGALDAAKAAGVADDATRTAVQGFGESVERIYQQDAELARQLFPTYVDEGLWVQARANAMEAVKASHAAEVAEAGAAAIVAGGDEAAAVAATQAGEAAQVVAANAGEVAEAAAPAATGGGAANVVDEAIVRAGGETPVVAAPVATTTAPTLPNATADAVEATITRPTTSTGSVIGANWTPANAGDGNFTGSVSEMLDRASRPRPTTAVPAPVATAAPAPVATATASQPVALSVNARGEAVTGSGLIVPSYTSVAGGFAPADVTPEAIARLQDTMNRVRMGAGA